MPAIALEVPPRRALGDLAVPVAFELARRLRKAPRAIAQEIVAALAPAGGRRHGRGRAERLHQRLHRPRRAFVRRGCCSETAGRLPRRATRHPGRGKTIVEHTAINPNKAAHIGHLRNATLGDTLVRMLRFRGVPVEVQNYIDDTGVQVADVVVGFRELEGKIARRHARDRRHDALRLLLLGPLRAGHRVVRGRTGAPRRSAARRSTRSSTAATTSAEIAAFIADRIVRAHLKTMARLNVDYDLLTWEGDILRLKFWATAFEILRDSGAMFLQTEGKLAGCWVMTIDEIPEDGEDAMDEPTTPTRRTNRPREGHRALERRRHLRRQGHRVPVLEVRPARQGFPLSALRDAHGRRAAVGDDDARDGGRATAAAARRSGERRTGRGMTYNVIDSRQTYLQKLLKQALATLGIT